MGTSSYFFLKKKPTLAAPDAALQLVIKQPHAQSINDIFNDQDAKIA